MSRAALYDHVGGPDTLYLGEVEDPAPGPGEVVLRVRSAGLNPFDRKLREGLVPSKAPFPRRIGSDVAGTVMAVGTQAAYWDGTPAAVGDEVLGQAPGSIAEQTVTPAGNLTIRPEAVPVEVAGGLHVAGLTAVSCLATVPVSAGDTLLVGGATGAVGLIVCQLAMAAGAAVIGTASLRNHDFVRSLGTEPVAYGPGLEDRLAPHGPITAVIDCHGREALDAGVALGVSKDRMTGIAAFDVLPELGLPEVDNAARTTENLAMLVEQIASGNLVVPVAQAFSLDEVVAAFTTLESSHAPGKIVILP